jgi:hypothetical protein
MILKNKRLVILISSIALGLLAGFMYWKFVGCTSGTCPLTSNWYSSTLFGGVFGYLIGDSFLPKKKTDVPASEKTDIAE